MFGNLGAETGSTHEESAMNDRPCVFIHTNHRQIVGAIVAEYSFRRNSRHADAFDVRIISTEDYPFLKAREGQTYLREGRQVRWEYENLQSFTPLRFMPPELMGYQGRALVVDPDVFAVGECWELLTRDLGDAAIGARKRTGNKGRLGCWASSVMVLDCARLTHWKCEENFDELFDGRRDYMDWICLRLEPEGSIQLIGDRWNDFDRLTPETRLIHNTHRATQPWKTGLPRDFNFASKRVDIRRPATWIRPFVRLKRAFGPAVYLPHPDPAQERFFFGLLKECVEQNLITEEMLRHEIAQEHVRPDAFEVLDRTETLAAQ